MQIKWPSVVALAVAGVGVSMVIYGVQKRERPPSPQIDQRVKEWAYVARSKNITPTEEVSLLVIPSEFGEPLDVKCLIYKNREFNQATMICPGAAREDISLPELDRAR